MGSVPALISKNVGNTLTNYRTWNGLLYNALDNGLKGGGVADDTEALQTLVNKAISEGRRTIFFPRGTNGQYYVTALTNADQVDFIGDNASFVGGYSGVIANLGGLAAHLADYAKQKNEWLRSLGSGIYVAHKGFNGYVDGTTTNGVVPSNSNLAFELAGKLGYKVVETDVQVLADGTWVVIHDANTGARLTGADELISNIDLANFKSRTFYREYLSNGAWWTYTGKLTECAPLTFEEFLLIAKKYGMFVMPEIKWSDTHTYTETDWQNYANVVKKVGMEDRTIVFSAYASFVKGVMNHLPNAIACMFIAETQTFLNDIKSYKNYIGSVGESNFTPSMEAFCKANSIPITVWTVDSYNTANDLFKRGVKLVSTNSLGNNYDISDYSVVFRDITSTLFAKTIESKSDGSSSVDGNDIVQFTTTNYNSRYYIINSSVLKRGDIIKLKSTAKTNLADPSSVARIFINNGGSGAAKRDYVINFSKNEYETKEIYYVVNDASNNVTVNFGLTSSNSILSTGYFKDIELTIYTKTDTTSIDNERFAMIYNYGTGAISFRPSTIKKGITSVSVDTDVSLLRIDYTPFKNWQGNPLVFIQVTDYSTNLKYHVVPVTDNATNGTVKLKVYSDSWVQVTDVSANLNLAFSVLIKNY